MQFRLIGITGAYIASGGNARFEETIPTSQLELLLSDVSKYRISIDSSEGIVKTPEYVALHQIVKNARGNFVVVYREGERWAKLSCQDQGPGICYENGTPLPPEKLPMVFGNFSTRKNGGLGLQFTKRLIELRKGDIEIISSPVYGHASEYSTLTRMSRIIQEPGFNGTRFTLYFPRTI